MRIFAGGSLGEGRQTIVESSRTAIFSVFAGYFFETLETRQVLLYSDKQSVATLNDLEWLFRVKCCFAPAWLASDRATFENNCVKANKDKHTLSAAQIFVRDYSFEGSRVNACLEHLFLAFENNCNNCNELRTQAQNSQQIFTTPCRTSLGC